MLRTLTVVFSAVFLHACSSEPAKPTAVGSPAPVQAAKPVAPPAAVSTATVSSGVETTDQRMGRALQALGGKGVYFNYDDYSVKPEFQELIKQHAELLKSAKGYSVSLEGNADERGSVEYNLALGQKRAEAVKRNLKLLGLPEAQVEAVSFGKEKPRATCHEEKCWSENRRVDFAYKKAASGK